MEISKRAFIVTGAASGLGEATARMIVKRGGSVIIADVNLAGAALATELGPAAHFVPTDVTSEADGIRAAGQWREPRSFDAAGPRGRLTATGQDVVSFASNDYLGLSQHPALKAAAIGQTSSHFPTPDAPFIIPPVLNRRSRCLPGISF